MFPNFLDQICSNKKKTMTKLSLMISHMSFMIDGWNVPYHVLKDNVDGMALFLFIFGPIFQG
jgi:hypothetical protein